MPASWAKGPSAPISGLQPLIPLTIFTFQNDPLNITTLQYDPLPQSPHLPKISLLFIIPPPHGCRKPFSPCGSLLGKKLPARPMPKFPCKTWDFLPHTPPLNAKLIRFGPLWNEKSCFLYFFFQTKKYYFIFCLGYLKVLKGSCTNKKHPKSEFFNFSRSYPPPSI